jgi:Secretion system C-terminal sorting domain/Fibronectin type III domain
MKKFLTTVFILSISFFGFNLSAQTCATPTGLNANPIYDFQATLNWTPVSGASFYNLRYRKVGTITFTTTTSTPATKVISGLTAATQYEFQVQTKCAVGTSTFAPLKQFTTTNSCSVPTNLGSHTVLPFSAHITWNAVAQALFYTTRYKKRDVVGAVFNTGTNNTNDKALGSLSQGTWYLFQVSTNCPGGQSAYSYLDSFLTPCAYLEPFNSPGTYADTNFQTPGDTIVYTDSAFCKYLARLKDTVGGNSLGTTIVTQTVNTGAYTSVDPNYIYGRRKTSVAPTSNGHGKLILSFSQQDFTQYNSNNTGFLDVPNFGDTNHIWTPRIKLVKVVGAVKTYFSPDSVRWSNSENRWSVYATQNSIAGDYYFFTYPDCVGLTVSGLTTSNVLGSSFRANWTQRTTPVFGWYSLRYKPVASSIWEDGGTSAYTTANKLLIGLTPNTNYEVQIRFHCSSLSEGPWSSSAFFTTLNTCWAPSSTNATNITGTGAKIVWPAAPGALFYTVKYRKAVGPGPWATGTTNVASKILTGLTTSTLYDVQVGTNCAGWLSPLTSILQFTTLSMRSAGNDVEEVFTKSENIEVFPNPANDVINIIFEDDANSGYELKIVDMHGKVVSSAHVESQQGENQIALDIAGLAKGVYSVQLFGSSDQVLRSKFVKE